MTQRLHKFLSACGFALGGTIAGFGLMSLFPQVERSLLNWQVDALSPSHVDSRVVLVTPPTGTDRACPQGRWHPEEFETVIVALKQSGVSLVASLEDFSQTSGPGCGELGGLAHLAETTKRVGNVLYPDSASAMLQQAAVGVGSVPLTPDHGSLLWIVPLPDQGPALPMGMAAASWVMHEEHSATRLPEAEQRIFLPRPYAADFPVHSFESIRDLFLAGESDRLATMFQGKIVLISSQTHSASPESTVSDLGSSMPVYHARIAQAVLTHSWFMVVPLGMAMALTGMVGALVANHRLRSQATRFSRWYGLAMLLIVLVGLGLLPQTGWLWPLGGTFLGIGFATTAALVWRAIHSQAGLQSRIREGQEGLARLQEELLSKQDHVRELESTLVEARSNAQESVSMVSGLHESQVAIRRQLQDSEEAVASTRHRIRHLQDELALLRRQVPASLSGQESILPADHHTLIQECAQFNILTRDSKLLEVFERLKKAAVTHNPILLLGETGTGKEVFARAAHALSLRPSGPFVSVNMAAIRPELFEGELFGHVKGAFTGAVGRMGLLQAANGGTLFLDEVGELPPEVQAKLLRVLEDGSFYRVGDSRMTTVDVRIVAATNSNLEKEIETGRYREDLYYRLRSIVLTLPPLRERSPEDRRLLAQSFLAAIGMEQKRDSLQLTQGAMEAILAYRWPGNVRELKQTIAQAVALTDESIISEFKLQLPKAGSTKGIGRAHGQEDLDSYQDMMVLQCLRRHRFDMQASARELGWDRSTVTQRLKGLGFQAVVDHGYDVHEAALALAGDGVLVRIVEGRLKEYTKNLLPASKTYQTADEAIADCRKRLRNLPERHFPAVERLIQERFSSATASTS